MKKLFSIFISVCLIISVFTVSASALNLSAVNDLASTNTNVTNLINYASSYPNFYESDYVCFTDADYSYYIVWGDFTVNNGVVTGGDIQYLHYYRTNTSGYNNVYDYEYGEDNTFKLNINDHIITSNINNLGFSSSVYDTYKTNRDTVGLTVIITSILFAIMLTLFRRS